MLHFTSRLSRLKQVYFVSLTLYMSALIGHKSRPRNIWHIIVSYLLQRHESGVNIGQKSWEHSPQTVFFLKQFYLQKKPNLLGQVEIVFTYVVIYLFVYQNWYPNTQQSKKKTVPSPILPNWMNILANWRWQSGFETGCLTLNSHEKQHWAKKKKGLSVSFFMPFSCLTAHFFLF